METSELGGKPTQTRSEHANSSGRPVSPVRLAKMVRLVESEIAKAKKQEQKSPSILRSSSGSRTRPSVPPLSDDIRDMGGSLPKPPGSR